MNILARRPGAAVVFPFVKGNAAAAGAVSVLADSFIVSPDGSKLYAASAKSVDVSATATGAQASASIPEAGVLFMALSPAGTYLITVQRPSLEGGAPAKNLKVWDLAGGQCVLSLSQKTVSKDSWPCVHWAPDDSRLFHIATNVVLIYSRADNFAAFRKLAVKGVATLAVSPGALPRLAAFTPETKGVPGWAAIYDYSLEVGGDEPLVRKSFFRCQGSTLMWNATGSALLALASSDFDATNQSYYGEQKLHFLPGEAARADKMCSVPVPKDGPVHDVQWAPAGDHFCVVAGFMPSKVTLFDAQCKPVFDFGSGPYNMVRWCPFSRLLMIAGFGNLPGDILFFEKKSTGVCKQVAAVRIPAVSAEWSPDGRNLLIAITAPRLRVDNGYKVLDYCGKQLAQASFDVLLEATWLPAAPGTHTDRPLSPGRVAAASGGGTSNAPVAGPAARPVAYRPPGSRGTTGDTPQFSLAFDPTDKHSQFQAAVANRRNQALPPGSDPTAVDKAPAKKPRKRSTKKAGDGGGDGEDGGQEEGDAAQPSSTGAGPSDAPSTAPPSMAGLSLQAGGTVSAEDAQKRIRALQKKLRQMDAIKERRDKQGEASLDPEQLQKLASEAGLLEELHSLGG